MAIYSLHHGWVGRTTHRAGTAGAHARYVTRRSAASLVLADGMPSGRRAAQTWLDQAEASDRANARVCDKLMLVLPREFSPAQRAALVRVFLTDLGRGRASWLAAIHDMGRDAHNPHAHVIFRDRDRDTGRRVACTTDKGSTDRLRLLWEQHLNAALKAAGSPQRVSRLPLALQGIERAPTRHRGPRRPLERTFNAKATLAKPTPVPPEPPLHCLEPPPSPITFFKYPTKTTTCGVAAPHNARRRRANDGCRALRGSALSTG